MFVIWGSYWKKGEKLGDIVSYCPNCKEEIPAELHIGSEIGHIYYIPLFPGKKDLLFTCSKCKKQYTLKEDSDKLELLRQFKRVPEGKKFKEIIKDMGTNPLLYVLPVWILIISLIGVPMLLAQLTPHQPVNYDDYYEDTSTPDNQIVPTFPNQSIYNPTERYSIQLEYLNQPVSYSGYTKPSRPGRIQSSMGYEEYENYFPYTYFSLIPIFFYKNIGGVFALEVENLGETSLFFYKYCVVPSWNFLGRKCFNDTNVYIEPHETKIIGLFLISPVYQHYYDYSIEIEPFIMNRIDKTWTVIWYNYDWTYGNKIVLGPIPLNSTYVEMSSYSVKPMYIDYSDKETYDRINLLINSTDSNFRSKALQIIANYSGSYNIHQVARIFDWVRDNINYFTDPNKLNLDYWATPQETLEAGGGDCDDYAILFAAFIKNIGGTVRVYLTSDHMFSAVYVGNSTSLNEVKEAIGEYYGDPDLPIYFFEDEYGYWVIADPSWEYSYFGLFPSGAELENKTKFGYYYMETITFVEVQ